MIKNVSTKYQGISFFIRALAIESKRVLTITRQLMNSRRLWTGRGGILEPVALLCLTGLDLTRRGRRAVLLHDPVVGNHALGQMVIDMANELPHAWTSSLHVQGGHSSILEVHRSHVDASAGESVTAHVEAVAVTAMG